MQELISYLDVLLACRPPESGRVALTLPSPGLLVPVDTAFSFEVPKDDRQFGCPPLPLFLKPLSPSKLLHIFAALLLERRIIVHSNRVDRLTHFMFGLTALLYPLEWPHPFTPILCTRGLGYCAATFPFLFGVHTSLIPQIMEQALESITWVNLDSGSISNPEDDAQYLRPQSLFNRLSSAIDTERSKLSKKSYRSNGDALWNPFISFWSSILVPSLKALKTGAGTFDSQSFLSNFDVSMRPLVQHIMSSQMFQQYIDERQEWAKDGTQPEREFDLCATRLASIHSSIMLQAYFDSIAQHGLGVLSNSLVPTTSQTGAAPIAGTGSTPPIATFSNALEPHMSSSQDEVPRMLPRRPMLKARPHSGSMQEKSPWTVGGTSQDSSSRIFSHSVSSSSFAPSSTSSFESGPPSCESDLLQLDLMTETPGSSSSSSIFSSSSSIFSFSPTNKTRTMDRLGASAKLQDMRKPWEAKAPTMTISTPTRLHQSTSATMQQRQQQQNLGLTEVGGVAVDESLAGISGGIGGGGGDYHSAGRSVPHSSSASSVDWFPANMPSLLSTPLEPLPPVFSASDVRSDLSPKKPQLQTSNVDPTLHFGLTPGVLRSDLDAITHI